MRSWSACRWVLLVLLLVGFLPATSSADTVTVTVSRGNVRAGPGVTHRVLTSVPQGATFPILATQQGWHQIRLNDGIQRIRYQYQNAAGRHAARQRQRLFKRAVESTHPGKVVWLAAHDL